MFNSVVDSNAFHHNETGCVSHSITHIGSVFSNVKFLNQSGNSLLEKNMSENPDICLFFKQNKGSRGDNNSNIWPKQGMGRKNVKASC